MKSKQTAMAWLGAGTIAFLSGLILFFADSKARSAFLNTLHTSPTYLLAMAGLFVIFVSALFFTLDKGKIPEE